MFIITTERQSRVQLVLIGKRWRVEAFEGKWDLEFEWDSEGEGRLWDMCSLSSRDKFFKRIPQEICQVVTSQMICLLSVLIFYPFIIHIATVYCQLRSTFYVDVRKLDVHELNNKRVFSKSISKSKIYECRQSEQGTVLCHKPWCLGLRYGKVVHRRKPGSPVTSIGRLHPLSLGLWIEVAMQKSLVKI